MFPTSDFSTPGISYVKDSYENYLDAVKKCMEQPFPNRNWDCFQVPPVYREQIMQYLRETYPQYKIRTYQQSGIWLDGDLDANIRVAIREVEKGDNVIEIDFIEDVCRALQVHFPEGKFEIQDASQVYHGTFLMGKKTGKLIVVDDYERGDKWNIRETLCGEPSDWQVKKIQEDIELGHRVFRTEHNEELIELLRVKIPGRKFELKKNAEVFPWDLKAPPKYTTVIVVDDFIVPPPKNLPKVHSWLWW